MNLIRTDRFFWTNYPFSKQIVYWNNDYTERTTLQNYLPSLELQKKLVKIITEFDKARLCDDYYSFQLSAA